MPEKLAPRNTLNDSLRRNDTFLIRMLVRQRLFMKPPFLIGWVHVRTRRPVRNRQVYVHCIYDINIISYVYVRTHRLRP